MATLQSNYSQELLDTYNRHHCAQSRTDQETKNHVKTAKKFAGACSITTNMIIFTVTITIAHYFALHGVQTRFLLFEGCFLLDPGWLSNIQQNAVSIGYAEPILLLYELLDEGCSVPIFRQVGPVKLYGFLSATDMSKKLIWGTLGLVETCDN